MATVQELQTKVDTLVTSVEAMKTRVSEDVAALRAQIEAGQVDGAALDQINTTLDSIEASVSGVDPDPENPPPA